MPCLKPLTSAQARPSLSREPAGFRCMPSN
jgi:hypothetical protein